MSFYNQKENEHCKDCWYKDAPYMSSYGTYTPCIRCHDGSEYATGMNECLVAGVQGCVRLIGYAAGVFPVRHIFLTGLHR